MIKKLMKYDTKKMFWVLGYIYIASIILAGITRLINIGKHIQFLFILGQVFSTLTYTAICSILVNTFVQTLRVFTTNFYKDESYLTHTLPISKNKLLLSKYLSALIVILSSVLVCFASLFILFYSKSFMSSLKLFIQASITNFNFSANLFIFALILVIFAQICTLISMAFTAIVKAYTYNTKRVLKGFIWFVIFYFGTMAITLLTMVVFFAITGNLSMLLSSTMSNFAFISILIIGFICYVAYAFIFYFICQKLFNKGVNID